MNIIDIKKTHAHLLFSIDELILLNNVLNELCYGINISDADIESRIGGSHSDMSDLLSNISGVIENIEILEEDECDVLSFKRLADSPKTDSPETSLHPEKRGSGLGERLWF